MVKIHIINPGNANDPSPLAALEHPLVAIQETEYLPGSIVGARARTYDFGELRELGKSPAVLGRRSLMAQQRSALQGSRSVTSALYDSPCGSACHPMLERVWPIAGDF